MRVSLLPLASALGGVWAALIAIPAMAESSPPAPVFKGVTVSAQTWGIEWQTPEMEAALDELKSLGVNSIAIHPYAQIHEDGHVVSGRRSGGSTTHITTPLRWAHERGMSTMLIPHIAYWGTKFLWRGEIDFARQEEWDAFFGDYETWIVQMATLAEAEHAELFCVGLEFSHAQKYEDRWRKIIAAVRAVYHGKMTYGANWDSYTEVKFWDALDYIGVLAYFPLTKTTDPGATEIAAAWEKRCAELEKFSKQYGKQFVFTEIGYNESARAAAEPWAFKTGGEHAAEIQARCLEVALDLPAKHPFLAGMYLWKWFPELPHHEVENYNLQSAPIKALIAKHWKR
jgi:glycosyl hydrolase family 113